MPYRAPGLLDGAAASVLDAWNELIARNISDQLGSAGTAGATPYLALPEDLPAGAESIHWSADPAEPRFCLDESWAQKLSDWSVRGRHSFHNEYCEYSLVTQVDAQGRVRLKRFTATTELPEWWITVATHDPAYLQSMAGDVLKRPVSFTELYGAGGEDPDSLPPDTRKIMFATEVAGNGYDEGLTAAGVPPYPQGDLNRRNALFMCHPINGLDDLIYIVIVGAQPYVVNEGGSWRAAELHEIFNAQGTTHLACRNADPAAAQGAFERVLKSVEPDRSSAQTCRIGFADPIGMYFVGFQDQKLFYDGAQVPASWTRFSRGDEGLKQRLEFGPSDEEEAYLDEVVVREGAAEFPIIGGYQLARLIEVGPRVLEGPEETTHPDWFEIAASDPSDCSEARVCATTVGPAKTEYEIEMGMVGLRGR